MNKYFVYMYMDQDNVPFYIGKGYRYRYRPKYHTYSKSHTSHKIRSIGIDNVKVHFLHKDLTGKEACSWERYWIKYFGRLDNGTGQLTNHTDGGEGTSGYKFSNEAKQNLRKAQKGHIISAETKQKISGALKGKSWIIGRTHSKETREKMSKSHKGKSSGMKGRKHSIETKQKISEAMKAKRQKTF